MDTLTELLEEQVKDLYNAENQLAKALKKLAKAASSEELQTAFETHLEETLIHVERLEEVAELMETKPTGKVCKAMKGLVEEGQEAIEEGADGHEAVADAGLIAAAQRVEHYEISAYGTARALAEQLGRNDLVQLFEQTLEEEKATDEKLTAIAESICGMAPKTEEDASGMAEEEDESASSGRGKGGKRPPSRAQASKGGKASKGGGKSGGAKKKTSRSR